MTTRSHLEFRAGESMLTESDHRRIERLIRLVAGRVEQFFGSSLQTHFQFGSSERDTNLPYTVDHQSDVDYLVVFGDPWQAPQTYFEQLATFATKCFRRTEIVCLNSSIILRIDGIRLDFVPAVSDFTGEYYIPGPTPATSTQWIKSSPVFYSKYLLQENARCNHLLKPVIRLAKLWNLHSGGIFNSFDLESEIAFQSHSLTGSIQDLFLNSIENLKVSPRFDTQQRRAIERAKRVVQSVTHLESTDRPNVAEAEVRLLVP